MEIIIFLLGTIIGSFLNVCIYRMPLNESIVFPSSHCVDCSTPLKWYDKIPIFSFFLLKGKCRFCGEKISPSYPLIEILTGVIFILLHYYLGLNLRFVFYAIILSVFIIITFVDIKHQIIPNSLIYTILMVTLIYRILGLIIFNKPFNLLNYILGMAIGFILFLIILILSKGGMGGGDVKLIGALGFILGFPKVLLNIFLSFVTGAIISIFLLAFKIKSKKDPIPFGPFIILGFIVTFFWGNQIINLYMSIL